MTKEEERKLKQYIPPKNYTGLRSYLYSIKYCPGYEGYKPENLSHKVCKYCGNIKYYH